MSASFSSILDRQASDIERPKPCPIGSFHGIVQGMPRIDKSKNKGTEFSEYTVKYVQALDDVDTDDLQTWLTKGDSVQPLGSKTIRVTFYHTEDSLYRLMDFLIHCGFSIKKLPDGRYEAFGDDEDKSVRQMIMETPNRQVGFTVIHKPSENGETIFANVGTTFKIED